MFSYDPLGELISADLPDGVVQKYTYDPVGNRMEMIDERGKQVYRYNMADQLLMIMSDFEPNLHWIEPLMVSIGQDDAGNMSSKVDMKYTRIFRYDANGNLIKVEGPGSRNSEYEYNGFNRIVSVQSAGFRKERYGYDALGSRVIVIKGQTSEDEETTRFLRSGGGRRVLAETDASGQMLCRYIYTPGGRLLARVDMESNKVSYYHFDALGNVVAASDVKGRIVGRYKYDPFGRRDSHPETMERNGYVGQWGVEEDSGGLQMMGAREYDPETGRFISRDPLAVVGYPLHYYLYANGDPINRIDPYGLYDWWEGVLGFGTFAAGGLAFAGTIMFPPASLATVPAALTWGAGIAQAGTAIAAGAATMFSAAIPNTGVVDPLGQVAQGIAGNNGTYCLRTIENINAIRQATTSNPLTRAAGAINLLTNVASFMTEGGDDYNWDLWGGIDDYEMYDYE